MNRKNFLKTSVFGAIISLFLSRFSLKSAISPTGETYQNTEIPVDNKIYVLGQNNWYLSELKINNDEWNEIKKVSVSSSSIVGTMDELIKQELDFLLENFVSLKYNKKDENFQKELDILRKKYKMVGINDK